jgi:hypothetical protein
VAQDFHDHPRRDALPAQQARRTVPQVGKEPRKTGPRQIRGRFLVTASPYILAAVAAVVKDAATYEEPISERLPSRTVCPVTTDLPVTAGRGAGDILRTVRLSHT